MRPRLKRRTAETLSARTAARLVTGIDWNFITKFGVEFNDDQLREAWERHRRPLMDYWLNRNTEGARRVNSILDFGGKNEGEGGPGTRPWGWWRFDAPEAKRRIGGTGTPLEIHPETGSTEHWRGGWGEPTVYGDDFDFYDEPTYETERDYLTRLNLLEPDEIEVQPNEAA